MSKGAGRACIKYAPQFGKSPGKRPARFNPGFQVKDQPVPTESDPRRLHQKLATRK